MPPSLADRLRPLGAVVVEPRVLRRIIRRHRGLVGGLGLEVVHGHCYTLPAAELRALVDRADLPADLPDLPLLLPTDTPPARVWRTLFHAGVHQALAGRRLTDAVLRERIHHIGQTEFDEIRFVLRQDELLLPPRDDREAYAELTALYLELRHFAPGQLARTFPTLRDLPALDALLALDVDAAAVLDATRPAGEPAEPVAEQAAPVAPAAAPRPLVVNRELVHDAAAARARGNLARAAIYALASGERAAARADLEALAGRLDVPADEQATWGAALLPLAEAAARDGRRRTPPLRLLYDLQKAALDLAREALAVDVVGWATSLGRLPLVRTLPAGREVRLARHLEHAAGKLARLRLAEDERAPLAALLHAATRAAGARARAALGPVIEAVLNEVGLAPASVPEEVARAKLVAELLDGTLERGRFGVGNLRDALSRSDLKLAGLAGPGELLRGDALLRADRALAARLGGVYHRGELYLRFLQKLSSLFFGTAPGRFLTRFALLPVLTAYIALSGVEHIVGPLSHHAFGAHVEIFSLWRCAALAVYVFGLLHVPAVRRATVHLGRAVGRALRFVFYRAPRALWRTRVVQALVTSRPARLVFRYGVKPAAFGGLVVLAAAPFDLERRAALALAAGAFLLANAVMSSRRGAHLEDVAVDAIIRGGRHVGSRLLPGLVRLILDLFKRLLERIERALYAVDEVLRFRRGDSRLALAVKATVGVVWSALAYLVRIYVNLLIEPTVNPIKHFPIVTVSAKIMLPITPSILAALRGSLVPVLGLVAGNAIAATTVLLLPGFWGFLAWELKENWRLYRRNRPAELGAVVIGHHGETMGAYLRPGLHSGTIPKAYARLRRAVWRGRGDAAKHKEALHHIEEAITRFAERELGALLARAPGWGAGVTVAGVEIGSNRVLIELERAGARATVAFEEQSGWLLGSVAEPGWIATLPPDEAARFAAALAGLYKRAGVDLVREQLAALLPAGAPYDVASEGLVVWQDAWRTEIIYPLDPEARTLAAPGAPPLQAAEVFFSRQPVTWDAWVASFAAKTAPLLAGPALLGTPPGPSPP